MGGARILGGLGDRVQGEAWNAVSTLLSGIAIFGALGYGLDHLFGTGPVLLVAGILLGKGLAAYLLYARHFVRFEEVRAQLSTPRVAGWSSAAKVAASGPQEHPKADLSAWPYRKGTTRAS